VWLCLGWWACGGGGNGEDSGADRDPGGPLEIPVDLYRDAGDPGTARDVGEAGPGPGEEVGLDSYPEGSPEVPGEVREDAEVQEDPCRDDPGASWCPCRENRDCQSGFCIATPEGRLCGAVCLENCPPGWFCGQYASNPDPIFLCLPRQQD